MSKKSNTSQSEASTGQPPLAKNQSQAPTWAKMMEIMEKLIDQEARVIRESIDKPWVMPYDLRPDAVGDAAGAGDGDGDDAADGDSTPAGDDAADGDAAGDGDDAADGDADGDAAGDGDDAAAGDAAGAGDDAAAGIWHYETTGFSLHQNPRDGRIYYTVHCVDQNYKFNNYGETFWVNLDIPITEGTPQYRMLQREGIVFHRNRSEIQKIKADDEDSWMSSRLKLGMQVGAHPDYRRVHQSDLDRLWHRTEASDRRWNVAVLKAVTAWFEEQQWREDQQLREDQQCHDAHEWGEQDEQDEQDAWFDDHEEEQQWREDLEWREAQEWREGQQ